MDQIIHQTTRPLTSINRELKDYYFGRRYIPATKLSINQFLCWELRGLIRWRVKDSGSPSCSNLESLEESWGFRVEAVEEGFSV